jgi:hypothetical protein
MTNFPETARESFLLLLSTCDKKLTGQGISGIKAGYKCNDLQFLMFDFQLEKE